MCWVEPCKAILKHRKRNVFSTNEDRRCILPVLELVDDSRYVLVVEKLRQFFLSFLVQVLVFIGSVCSKNRSSINGPVLGRERKAVTIVDRKHMTLDHRRFRIVLLGEAAR